MALTGLANVIKNVKSIYDRRRAAVYALSLYWAAQAINYFRAEQANNRYWQNRTGQARDRMFTRAFMEQNIVGWFMAHGVQYGVYLELANDGLHEAIRPIIKRYAGRFINAVKELYADAA